MTKAQLQFQVAVLCVIVVLPAVPFGLVPSRLLLCAWALTGAVATWRRARLPMLSAGLLVLAADFAFLAGRTPDGEFYPAWMSRDWLVFMGLYALSMFAVFLQWLLRRDEWAALRDRMRDAQERATLLDLVTWRHLATLRSAVPEARSLKPGARSPSLRRHP